MALPTWANDSITRIRPGTITRRGSEEPDWENVDEKEIEGCTVQPSSTSLSQDGRVLGTSEGLTCFLPPGADVRAGDKIRWNEEDYQIIGKPKNWKSPSGRVSNTQIQLERWDG